MREDLLHFIWKYRKFTTRELKTSQGQAIEILDHGTHNKYSGPDFLNARILIGGQLWAGNVEIHLRTSDWFLHGHQTDEAYDNVVLHIVWEEDRELLRKSGIRMPTLELRKYVNIKLINRYEELQQTRKSQFIPCQGHVSKVHLDSLNGWSEKLYRERLEDKTKRLVSVLKVFKMDWERLLFTSLLRNFGQRVNAESFLSLALALDFNIVRKLAADAYRLECILLGLCGILQKYSGDTYGERMFREYRYLKRKYNLIEERIEKPEFMKVRPSGFPTIRLSQFAMLYSRHTSVFSKLMSLETKEEFYDFFDVEASEYWNTHYIFGRALKEKRKKLSRTFINQIIINTVLPVKNIYLREYGQDEFGKLKNLLLSIRRENISLIENFRDLGFPVHHALDSQAILQLHDTYCSRKRCLECAIGNQILN